MTRLSSKELLSWVKVMQTFKTFARSALAKSNSTKTPLNASDILCNTNFTCITLLVLNEFLCETIHHIVLVFKLMLKWKKKKEKNLIVHNNYHLSVKWSVDIFIGDDVLFGWWQMVINYHCTERINVCITHSFTDQICKETRKKKRFN